jgi:hypothetical protein
VRSRAAELFEIVPDKIYDFAGSAVAIAYEKVLKPLLTVLLPVCVSCVGYTVGIEKNAVAGFDP